MGIYQFIMDLKLNIQFITKWFFISIILGGICGVIGAFFHISVDYVTELRIFHSWI